jgi:CheY-like chemotaxis protein
LEVLCSVPAPCLILLDLMMPVMNGWDLLDALRRRADLSRIPVIVTSAAPDANTARARALLRKPYDLDKLLATVQRYCRPGAS